MPAATELPTATPPAHAVYRLGYGPDPFLPVPWRILRQRDARIEPQHDDQTVGGRFDDPAGRDGVAEARRFRTIYCASERIAVFGESLLPFRGRSPGGADGSDKERPAALQAIMRRNPILQEAAGSVPGEWLAKHRVGTTYLDPGLAFVDLGHRDTLRYIRRHFAGFAGELGIGRIDYGVLLGSNRQFTQALAGHFYEQLNDERDEPRFAGIRYLSTLGLDWECWAIFDQRLRPEPADVEAIDLDDPDLVAAAQHLDLTVGSA